MSLFVVFFFSTEDSYRKVGSIYDPSQLRCHFFSHDSLTALFMSSERVYILIYIEMTTRPFT